MQLHNFKTSFASKLMHWSITGFAAIACLPAMSQGSPWSLRVGPAAVLPHVEGNPEAPKGNRIPGGSVDVESGWTLGAELGYDLTKDWTAHLVIGTPVTSKVTGKGVLAPLGKLGDVSYGPAALSATYCVGTFGAFRPYIGVGVAYLIITSTKDAGMKNLEAKNNFGSVLQIGADINIGKRVGLFIDVRSIFVKSEVSGAVTAFGGVPAYANLSIDPLVIHGGVSYRF